MIYITGDCHTEFNKFSVSSFPEQKNMTKNDVVIICGDFGGIWDTDKNSAFEGHWLKWLDEKPFTTLFIDGNHENFDRLNSEFETVSVFGGKAHKIRSSIYHLLRGEVFEIEGIKFFAFGGARSHDIKDGVLEPGDPRIKRYGGRRSCRTTTRSLMQRRPLKNSIIPLIMSLLTVLRNQFQTRYLLNRSSRTSLPCILTNCFPG